MWQLNAGGVLVTFEPTGRLVANAPADCAAAVAAAERSRQELVAELAGRVREACARELADLATARARLAEAKAEVAAATADLATARQEHHAALSAAVNPAPTRRRVAEAEQRLKDGADWERRADARAREAHSRAGDATTGAYLALVRSRQDEVARVAAAAAARVTELMAGVGAAALEAFAAAQSARVPSALLVGESHDSAA